MDFQDFPQILGNLGVETDHSPKMCAGLDYFSRCLAWHGAQACSDDSRDTQGNCRGTSVIQAEGRALTHRYRGFSICQRLTVAAFQFLDVRKWKFEFARKNVFENEKYRKIFLF